jgi:hypothetical protein
MRTYWASCTQIIRSVLIRHLQYSFFCLSFLFFSSVGLAQSQGVVQTGGTNVGNGLSVGTVEMCFDGVCSQVPAEWANQNLEPAPEPERGQIGDSAGDCAAAGGTYQAGDGIANNSGYCDMPKKEDPKAPQAQQPQQPPPPPPCVAETQRLANSCAASRSGAQSSCSGSQMDSYKQDTGPAKSNANQACGNAGTYHSGYASGLQGYHQSCSSAVNSCASQCENARRSAESCSRQGGTIPSSTGQKIQAGLSSCTGSGELASRPAAIQQEIGAAQFQQAQSEACQAQSSQSSDPNAKQNSGGNDEQKTPDVATNGGPGTGGIGGEGTDIGRGDNSPSPNKNGIGGDEDINGLQGGRDRSEMDPRYGDNSNGQNGGLYGAAANAKLAGLPGKKEGQVENIEENEKSTEVFDGMGVGTSARRLGFRVPLKSNTLTTDGQPKTAKEAMMAKPDLSKFLPTGLQRRPTGLSHLPPDVHGKHVNWWDVMHKQYLNYTDRSGELLRD